MPRRGSNSESPSGATLFKYFQTDDYALAIDDYEKLSRISDAEVQESFYDLLETAINDESFSSKKFANNLSKVVEYLQKRDEHTASKITDILQILLTRMIKPKDIEKLRGDSSTRRKLYEENPTLKRCLELIQALSMIPSELFKLRLEPEILYVTRLTSVTPQMFNRRYNQIRTSLYYKQKRFNLLREESEGFTKLITELCAILDSGDNFRVEEAMNTIKSLIGCFRLDGNKVLNCILIALEHAETPTEQQRMVEILKSYTALSDDGSTPANLIAFRLDNCKAYDTEKTTLQKIPETFFRLIALLIREKVIDLKSIWPKMKPDNEKLKSVYEEQLSTALKTATKTKVSLNDDGPKKDIQEETLFNITAEINFVSFQKVRVVRYLMAYSLYDVAFEIVDSLPHLCLVSNVGVRRAFFHTIIQHLPRYYNKYGRSATVALLNPCSEMDDELDMTFFRDVVLRTINYCGPFLSEHPDVLVKCIRTIRGLSETNEEFTSDLLEFIQATALPSLNLIEGNAAIANEIWSAIEKFPFQNRFDMYKEWLDESTWQSHASLANARTQISARVRWLLKRLTKENFKQYGRQIGKISHSNPGVLFTIFLSQIQRYENLINPVVESLRISFTFTLIISNHSIPLAFDTLAFCLMNELKDESKPKLQDDGCSIATWLQAMASFCGQVYKRHNMELGGLLLYVAEQLKDGKSMFELVLLKEIIHSMTGIEANGEPTADQMEALAGGEVLRSEGGYYGQIKNYRKSSTKLREAMKTEKLETALILLIALQRDRVLFGKSQESESDAIATLGNVGNADDEQQGHLQGARLKLVGDMIDMCHGVMYQLSSFVTSQNQYNMIPADQLIKTYHAPVDVAFSIARKVYFLDVRKRMQEKFRDLMKTIEKEKAERRASAEETKENGEVMEVDEDKAENSTKIDKAEIYVESVKESFTQLRQEIVTCMPESLWTDLTPVFFTSFWTMDSYDLKVPTMAYNREIIKLKEIIKEIDADKTSDSRTRRSKAREKERCVLKIEQIREEQKRHMRHVQCVEKRLEDEKDQWIDPKKNDTVTKMLQHCVFKRAVFSAEDSMYCANFILKMHYLSTPHFQTLLFLDRVFTDTSYTIGSLTEQQAIHYGRFLNRLYLNFKKDLLTSVVNDARN